MRDVVAESVGPPAAPCGLTAMALASTAILVTWNDNSTDEDYLWVERCEGSVDSCSDTEFLPFDFVVSPNETTLYDESLPPNVTFTYRVRAFNDAGASAYSNTDDATTFAPMSAPSNLVAAAVTDSRIDLTWVDNSDREDRYDVERCTGTAAWCAARHCQVDEHRP